MKNKIKSIIIIVSVLITQNISAQVTGTGTNRPGASPGVVGWTTGTAGSLEIRNDFTSPGQPIEFYTNNALQMTVNGSGQLGIGISPTFKLQVLGAIDINTPTTYYSIGGVTVLHNPGNRNIFSGAGTAAALTAGTDNTFNGWNAGTANTGGSLNTFIGSLAGASNQASGNNTFVGYRAGTTNNGGLNNLFAGADAGRFNTIGQG